MKIAIGLSGGVDSSVAALLLRRQGHDIFGLFMRNWDDTTGTLQGHCTWEEDLDLAKMVARKLDIPFFFTDLSEAYRSRVAEYMFREYGKGRPQSLGALDGKPGSQSKSDWVNSRQPRGSPTAQALHQSARFSRRQGSSVGGSSSRLGQPSGPRDCD